jgi:hypothetical protein
MDRVTGEVEATSTTTTRGEIFFVTNYVLKCRPAQRLF